MKKIYLIDWYSFIYRMFFAMPEFTNPSWEIVNALFWISKFFLVQLVKLNPDYIIFIKDASWKNFRHDLYEEYKATRDKMPDNLRNQINLIDEFLEKIDQKVLSYPWYEADDVIATLSEKLKQDKNNLVYILSSDKDLYSLVNIDNVKIFDFQKQAVFWYEEAKNKFDVNPEYIIDYLAIVWDSADNIPWISWFWAKKRVSLINTYWTLENIYKNIENPDFIIKWKNFEILKNSQEIAFLSKKLATLEKNVNLQNFEISDFIFKKDKIFNENLIDFLKTHNFMSLLPENEKKFKTIKDIKHNIIKVENKNYLKDLEKKINNEKEIFFYLKTIDQKIIYDSKIINIWIKINNDYYIINIFDKEDIKNFFKLLFSENNNLKIIWYDMKKNLKLIDIFINQNKNTENNFWQLNLI